MSGTGRGDRSPEATGGPTSADRHLGDRLSALVDGELEHEARERVLAHLATCPGCKAEADAQRRLKNVFADTAPPSPSEGLLARLQGLPAGPPPPSDGGTPSAGAGGGALSRAATVVGATGSSPWDFEYLPGGRGHSALFPRRGFGAYGAGRGGASPAPFPAAVAGVGPQGSASRGRRFAFAAAGAFSLAALALGGGALSTVGGGGTNAAGDNAAAGPARTAKSGTTSDRDRRRGDKPSTGQRAAAAQVAPLRAAGAAAAAPPALSPQPASIYPPLRDARFNTPVSAPPLRPAGASPSAPAPVAAPSPSAPGAPAAPLTAPPGYGTGFGNPLTDAVSGQVQADRGGSTESAAPALPQRH